MSDHDPAPSDVPPVTTDPQSIEGLFVTALAQASPEEREAFLAEACGGDAGRRRRVEALLRAYDDAGSFLEHPPVGAGAADSFNLDFLTPSDDPGLLGTLGPYEVYEVLGRGGMGIVFRARDPKLNRVVAIKVLAPELAANPLARRRFLREAQAAAAISHPHVVTIHAVDEGVESPELRVERKGPHSTLNSQHSTLPFIVMECIVGQTLQQKLDKQGSLRLTETLRIGQQVACGLAAAHKQGLIHRDIKPANVLLENGIERVKITDFGLARLVDDVSITRTGEVSGTPQYMSPEQASGDPVDHRSDLFSLGCVLYAMCTGRSPFRATSLAAAIRRVCDDTPRPIQEINPEAPPWLIEIINRLLEKNPDDRLQSAEEVSQLLSDRLAGLQLPHTSSKPTVRRIAHPPAEPTVVPSDRRVGKGLLVCGLIFLAAPWLLAGAESLMFGELRFMSDRWNFQMPSALGLLTMLVGWTVLLIFDRWANAGKHAKADDSEAWDRRHAIGRGFLLFGLLLIFGVSLAGIYSATGLPQLPAHLQRDFGTTVFPILLVAGVLLLVGTLLRLPLFDFWRPSFAGDRSRHWDIRRIGRTAILSGLAVIAAPSLPIAFGFMFGDGDPMEFGGRLVLPAANLGIVMFIMGCITLLVAYAADSAVARQHPESTVSHRPLRDRALAGGKGRSSVLGWLLVSGLVLVPILLAVSIGVYRSQERDRSRETSGSEDVRPLVPVAVSVTPTVDLQRPTTWDESAATARLTVDVSELRGAPNQIGIALHRKNSGGGFVPEEPCAIDLSEPVPFGQVRICAGENTSYQKLRQQHAYQIPPGYYDIWVYCRQFGWAEEPISAIPFTELPLPARWDASRALFGQGVSPSNNAKIEYVWNSIAARHPEVAKPTFYWNGRQYDLNFRQARIIQRLLEGIAASPAEIAEQELLRINALPFPFDGDSFDDSDPFNPGGSDRNDASDVDLLAKLFDDGDHAAWGTLVIPGTAPDTYRLARPQIPHGWQEPGDKPSSPVPAPPLAQPTPSDAAASPFPQGREGTLNIDIKDDGLVVALRRISAFGGYVPGTEQQIADVGSHQLPLPAGEYEVLIRDTQFGWGDRKRTITVGREATDLVVDRDLADYAKHHASHVLPPKFRWDGSEYWLRYFEERFIVLRLVEAYSSGHPEVHEKVLLDKLPGYPHGSRGVEEKIGYPLQKMMETLADVFEHPEDVTPAGRKLAWGNLIVPGEQEGTYRLKPVPRGTMTVTIVDEGMWATVRPVDPQADVDPRQVAWAGTQSWALPPGEYQVIIADSRVGWDWFTSEGAVRMETVTVTDGETTDVEVDRRFQDYVEVPPLNPAIRIISNAHIFRWFVSLQGGGGGVNLSPDQAACVSVLLQALVDGEPEVAEAELLKTAKVEAESLEEVFNGITDPDHSHWNRLIVPGETEGTWRLKPPPEEAAEESIIQEDGPVDDVRPRADDPPPGEPMGNATFRHASHRLATHISFSRTFQMCG